ncbi:TDP-N-acetylfucosamine:lipid II N-acetylfucosaminyltransferase family protein [Butyricimonas paravirosa]|uniref:TDP-N-acetylfucosamine:lipid II N-acetylfucosaminyltransferase n=1 Tax=Butyricimonas paravirosa TaxID=1472417 RepID=UPI0022E8EAED|nr:TDP-N-acetylfucosamine:lipid II N-acetylfucosaminyltransferase [Butyricimonas paravirosa]
MTMTMFDIALPSQNMFICFCNKKKECYIPKYINETSSVYFFDIAIDRWDLVISDEDKIVIHYLNKEKQFFINKYVPREIKIYWIIWGADLFNNILENRGYKIYAKCNSVRNLKYYLKKITNINYFRTISTVRFIRKRIKYVLTTTIKKDDPYIKKLRLPKSIRFKEFFYYPIDYILGDDLKDKSVICSSKNILCGNSASFTNNHEYVIKELARIGISDYSVKMPLSYGGSEEYIYVIEKKGKKVFGRQFEVIKSFLPLNEYNIILQHSPICVYGNWRPEAFGNILIVLYLGAKVYFSKYNQHFYALSDMGLRIFTLETAQHCDFFQPLSCDEQAQNREILKKKYSFDRLLSIIQHLF